ncbi:hypothetical protein PQX77_005637 [Marasmius sp. AFHP31]|nr:hypothetical protein PQX77_005637 [Marasmius sp. AFHP31]
MTTAIHTTTTTSPTAATSKPVTTTTKTFHADAVLFDMDDTLTNSTSAVEAAWGRVAQELNMDRDYVIAATHGKRAIDNLRQLKPHLQELHNDDMFKNLESRFWSSPMLTILMDRDPEGTRLSLHDQGATRFFLS